MGRLLRPTLAGALVLMALVPFGADAGAPLGDDLGSCSEEGQITQRKDGWTEIKSPTYAVGEGADVITASALPQKREWVYVTNGRVLRLSVDAGCKFAHIYRPTLGVGAQPNDSRVLSHLSTPTPTGIWVAGYDNDGDLPRPHVVMTEDATPVPGNTTAEPFHSVDLGLPGAGRPFQIYASGREDEAYLLLDEPRPGADALTNPIRRLYRTVVQEELKPTDLAVRWEQLTLPDELGGNVGGIRSGDGQIVWTWSGTKYAQSKDRGKTWKVATASAPITEIDVNEKGTATLFLNADDGPGIEQFTEPGVLLAAKFVPTAVTSAVHGSRSGVYAVTGPGGTYGFDLKTRTWAPLSIKESPSTLHMGVASGGRILVGQLSDKLLRFDLWPNEAFIAPAKDVRFGDPIVDPESKLIGPVFDVSRAEVTVAPKELADSTADFGLNPKPQPIDVFFLMDTTMSMARAIEDLQKSVKGLAADLEKRSKGKACFGLGEFKDFTARADERSNSAIAYQLHQKIQCGSGGVDNLEVNLKKLKQSGGSGPEAEAATLAMSTAVTGAASVTPPIAAGQDAGFMNPTRVIVLISDAGFMEGPTLDQGTYPTIDQTVKALQAYNTKVVSILVKTNNDEAAAYEDMEAVSMGTETVAPPEGVDCDGSGKPDLRPGSPLVCDTDGDQPDLAPAIVGLLLGIKDPGTMGIDIDDPHNLVQELNGEPKKAKNPRIQEVKNLRVENHLLAKLTLSCSAAQDGMDLPVTLTAGLGLQSLLRRTIVVHCRAPKVPVVVPPPPPPVVRPQLPPPPEPVLPPAAPRPPIVIPIAPVFQPPAPNNPISNVNPNAGFSQQEEQQFQLAPVTNAASEEADQATEEVDLAMVAVNDDDPAALVVYCGALMMSAAGGVVYAQRRRTQRSMRASYVRIR